MLTRVTITGADDAVDPQALARLSGEFPFVEWGILLSPKRTGTPRYPSWPWVLAIPRGLRLSLHLCGEAARDTLAGKKTWLLGRELFQRVQVNGYGPRAPELVTLAGFWPDFEFILQVRTESDIEPAAADVRAMGPRPRRAAILWDPSGGQGLVPARRAPIIPAGEWMGFAGGITPDNVDALLRGELADISKPFWIDMESGVRSGEDAFDLKKVRRVLENAAQYVRRSEAR